MQSKVEGSPKSKISSICPQSADCKFNHGCGNHWKPHERRDSCLQCGSCPACVVLVLNTSGSPDNASLDMEPEEQNLNSRMENEP
jgi:hypothetical protein